MSRVRAVRFLFPPVALSLLVIQIHVDCKPSLTHFVPPSDADLNLNRNAFVETTLSYVLSYITSVTGEPSITPATITILADNDYYSTPASIQEDSASPGTTKPSRFHDFAIPLTTAPKTGLGSSAALVTAVTAALLKYYLPSENFPQASDPRVLHNLAQAAHCAAQGKVGSGFDVASAVYGTCLYRRFSPSILAARSLEPGVPRFADELRGVVDDVRGSWDTEIAKDKAVKVPDGLRLIMCDVACGSKTPGMVKQVLAWRAKESEEAGRLWRELDAANVALADQLKTVAESGSKDYAELTKCFVSIRILIREMGQKSGVPIEPQAQTELLDACAKVNGVVGGVVPGAGGYDAICLLIEDRDDVVVGLEKLFKEWDYKGEGGGGKVSMLRVREEMKGVKVEDPKVYVDWLKGF